MTYSVYYREDPKPLPRKESVKPARPAKPRTLVACGILAPSAEDAMAVVRGFGREVLGAEREVDGRTNRQKPRKELSRDSRD